MDFLVSFRFARLFYRSFDLQYFASNFPLLSLYHIFYRTIRMLTRKNKNLRRCKQPPRSNKRGGCFMYQGSKSGWLFDGDGGAGWNSLCIDLWHGQFQHAVFIIWLAWLCIKGVIMKSSLKKSSNKFSPNILGNISHSSIS